MFIHPSHSCVHAKLPSPRTPFRGAISLKPTSSPAYDLCVQKGYACLAQSLHHPMGCSIVPTALDCALHSPSTTQASSPHSPLLLVYSSHHAICPMTHIFSHNRVVADPAPPIVCPRKSSQYICGTYYVLLFHFVLMVSTGNTHRRYLKGLQKRILIQMLHQTSQKDMR